MVFVFLCLTYSTLHSCSRSIHVIAKGKILFLKANIPLYICIYIYIYNILFMHSSINRHLGCFCMLAIVNKATTYIGCTYFFQISVFTLSNYTWVKLLNQRAILFLIFWETSTLFSIMAAPIYNPTYSTQGFLFSTSLLLHFW